jgi:hypothetical protein
MKSDVTRERSGILGTTFPARECLLDHPRKKRFSFLVESSGIRFNPPEY